MVIVIMCEKEEDDVISDASKPPETFRLRHNSAVGAKNAASVSSFVSICESADECTLRLLIETEGSVPLAVVNQRDLGGKSGLAQAAAAGYLTILHLLCPLQPDPNLADNEGNTPLILAAQAGHHQVVSVLITRLPGLAIDQRNVQGFTALMKSAVQGRTKCARLLLSAGACPSKRDFGRGLTALEWAEYCGREQCAAAILAFQRHEDTVPQTADVKGWSHGDQWHSEGSLHVPFKERLTFTCAIRRIRRSIPFSRRLSQPRLSTSELAPRPTAQWLKEAGVCLSGAASPQIGPLIRPPPRPASASPKKKASVFVNWMRRSADESRTRAPKVRVSLCEEELTDWDSLDGDIRLHTAKALSIARLKDF